jgi:hypothetical protein
VKSLGYISGTNLGDFKTQRDDRLQRLTFRKRLKAFKTSERTFELRNTLSILGRRPRASKDSHLASALHCRKCFLNVRTHFRTSKHPLDLWKTPSSFERFIFSKRLTLPEKLSKRQNALSNFETPSRSSKDPLELRNTPSSFGNSSEHKDDRLRRFTFRK